MPRQPITDVNDIPEIFSPRDKESKVKCTQAEMEMRRLEVSRRRLCGQPLHQIANELGYSVVTISKDIAAIQESNIQLIQNFEQEDFISESLEVYKKVEREAFTQLYEVPDGDVRKSKFLKDIRDTRKATIELLQDSGLVRKEPKKIDVDISIDVLNHWTSEQKTLVCDAILDAAVIGPVEEDEALFDPYADALKQAQNVEGAAEFIEQEE
jgi:hypothetical protein